MALRQHGMIFASQGAAEFEKVGVAKLLGLCRWPKGPKKYSPGFTLGNVVLSRRALKGHPDLGA